MHGYNRAFWSEFRFFVTVIVEHGSIQSRLVRWIVSIPETGRDEGVAVWFEANSRQFRGNLP
ncbi:hypothetical protein GCM10007927_17340 [Sulfitobacter pacificus]|uniref:Uncharacterized protein n=1 Tax=Sulfitobacter pacificus TaxID=1499314 RepID=A0ABQ5VIJ6_9RHOB|nr:hypothetical protein GCM10007927_17340 [Sulfitobacter pacificus]